MSLSKSCRDTPADTPQKACGAFPFGGDAPLRFGDELVEGRVVGAAHHRELSVLGTRLATRHRCIDEADAGRGHIAWISPMARALLKAREGETVSVQTPDGRREVEIVEVRYQAID